MLLSKKRCFRFKSGFGTYLVDPDLKSTVKSGPDPKESHNTGYNISATRRQTKLKCLIFLAFYNSWEVYQLRMGRGMEIFLNYNLFQLCFLCFIQTNLPAEYLISQLKVG